MDADDVAGQERGHSFHQGMHIGWAWGEGRVDQLLLLLGELLGGGWDAVLRDEMAKPYWRKLLEFVAVERDEHTVYPPPLQTFRAFELTPYDDVRVVILGQDPYPNEGDAHGLAFSVPADVQPKPGSLRNIHKVLESDLSATFDRVVKAPDHGSLEAWAEQGVLLLNTALTVRAGNKEDRDTHRLWRWEKQGWTTFSDTRAHRHCMPGAGQGPCGACRLPAPRYARRALLLCISTRGECRWCVWGSKFGGG